MTESREANHRFVPEQEPNYYTLLGLAPTASALQIRRAYRELSKRYHPDTTVLPLETAKSKFQQLNEAYGTLMNSERRLLYDQRLGYARLPEMEVSPDLEHPMNPQTCNHYTSTQLDPSDRPLSAGEIFALFLLGFTFVGCLILAIAIGVVRGDMTIQSAPGSSSSAFTALQKTHPSPEETAPSL